jgi:hypothetical protein
LKTEKHLQDYIMDECKRLDVLCHKMESRSCRGWPDLVLIYGGRVVFVEVKSPAGTGRLSALQIHTINDITLHGGRAAVVESKHEADLAIWKCLRGEPNAKP